MCLFIIINDLEPVGVLDDNIADNNIENFTDNGPKDEKPEKMDTNNDRSEIIEIKEKLPLDNSVNVNNENEEELPFDDKVLDTEEVRRTPSRVEQLQRKQSFLLQVNDQHEEELPFDDDDEQHKEELPLNDIVNNKKLRK